MHRFDPGKLAGVDEPVRRYFSHAISDGAPLPNGVRMAMSGRIKVGLWLPFTAEQTVDGRSFTWRARVGPGPLTPLRVVDRYADDAGSTEGVLLGRVSLFHADDVNTTRSAATRAAIESVVFAPACVLPGGGVGECGEKTFQYIPFGGEVHDERHFGDFVVPSTLSVGWWFDTARYAAFFKANILDLSRC